MLAIETSGVAVITGAASGIGKETAFLFAEAGAQGIVFADLNIDAARAAADESKPLAANPSYRAVAVAVDVANSESVQAMAEAAVAEFGRIDYGINCAGIGPKTRNTVAEASMAEYDAMFAINLKGTVLCTGAVARVMMGQEPRKVAGRSGERSAGRGSIVNVASGNGYVAEAGKAPYTASKFAVIGVTKTAAIENARHGIRVNAVCPGPVHTPMMEAELVRAPHLTDIIRQFTPLGRMAVPEEIAQMIVYLASPAATYINGTGLLIDGGITLGMHTG